MKKRERELCFFRLGFFLLLRERQFLLSFEKNFTPPVFVFCLQFWDNLFRVSLGGNEIWGREMGEEEESLLPLSVSVASCPPLSLPPEN